jgi:hypothetical protein
MPSAASFSNVRSRRCGGAQLGVEHAADVSSADRARHSFLDSAHGKTCGARRTGEGREVRGGFAISASRGSADEVRHASCLSTGRDAGEPMMRPNRTRTQEEPMTTTTRSEMGSFVVVSLDQIKQGLAEIRSVLESLGIDVEVVESGRRLRWNAAVVLRIPERRIPEAMLALGMKGFSDVMAYQSGESESWGSERSEAGSNTVR